MRIDPCVETYFSSKCGLEGEGMSIFRKKEANLSTDSVRFQVLTPKGYPRSLPEAYSIVKEQSSWRKVSVCYVKPLN